MKLNKNLFRAVAVVVTATFFFQDLAFAMGPGLISGELRPDGGATREDGRIQVKDSRAKKRLSGPHG